MTKICDTTPSNYSNHSNHACNIHILDIYVCVCVGVNEMFLYNISSDCHTLLIAENSPINLTNLV